MQPDGLTALGFVDDLPFLGRHYSALMRAAICHITAVIARAAADPAELRKDDKFTSLRDRGIDFRPIALETLGAFGRLALEGVDLIVESIWNPNSDSQARSRLVRRLAAAVQSGNAARILETRLPCPLELHNLIQPLDSHSINESH